MALIMKIIALLTLGKRKFDTRRVRPLLTFIDNVKKFEEIRLELQVITKVRNFTRCPSKEGISWKIQVNLSHYHSVARRIPSVKNLNDPIGNQTRDFPPCNALPQPTVPRRTVSGQNVADRSRILK